MPIPKKTISPESLASHPVVATRQRVGFDLVIARSIMVTISSLAFLVSLGMLALIGQVIDGDLLQQFSPETTPSLFFSDLPSGPATGGPDGDGAFVTVYGKRFGTKRNDSYIAVGGVKATNYLLWNDQKITFQVPHAATQNGITINQQLSLKDNVLPFTVRPGKIYFVATTGDDNAVGSFDQPWKTLWHAKRQLMPGDTLYIKDNIVITELESQARATLEISERLGARHGTAQRPIAIIALPGATPIIGCARPDCPTDGVTTFLDHWIFAGLWVTGNLPDTEFDEQLGWGSAGFKIDSSDIRLVGNTVFEGGYYGVTIPNAVYEESTKKRDNIVILGNHIYGTRNSMIYHGGFPVIDGHVTSGFEVGWNYVHDNLQGFGIKILAHKPEDVLRDIKIHDNLIVNPYYSGIQLGGGIEAIKNPPHVFIEDATIYNNVIVRAGSNFTAGKAIRDHAVESCIELGHEKNMRAEIYHNTLVDCGKSSIDIREDFDSLRFENNIFVQTNERPFFIKETDKIPQLVSHNLYFGQKGPPGYEKNAVIDEPRFFNLSLNNFHLAAISPAIRKGTQNSVVFDRDGLIRNTDNTVDLGAYEYNPGLTPTFSRGDVDGNTKRNISDVLNILQYLFLGGQTPGCLDASDTNDDGVVNITDSTFLLNYLFLSGFVPPEPFEQCGVDTTSDNLGCNTNICGSY